MRSIILAASALLLVFPMIASAAASDDDGIVILSVVPRDPSVKPEFLLTPAKEKKVAVRDAKPESSEPVPQLARAEVGSR